MKRYLLFAGDNYYPSGGWKDFIGSFNTVEEAKDELIKLDENWEVFGWYHIVDSETWDIIK